MSDLFDEESTNALLLVNADTVLNSINREVLLHDTMYFCPLVAIYIRNCYSVLSVKDRINKTICSIFERVQTQTDVLH